MPTITDPNLGLNYGWTLGESGWAPSSACRSKTAIWPHHLPAQSTAIVT